MSAFNLNKVTLNFIITDVSTAGQIFVPIPDEFDGDIVEIRTALNGAIITADAVLTPKINGVAVTNGAITIANSGSAAGDVDVSRPTSSRTVRPGEAIEIETNGASGNSVAVTGTIVILR
jgi:hypothetical protein